MQKRIAGRTDNKKILEKNPGPLKNYFYMTRRNKTVIINLN